MEPALRRAARSLCGRCSASLRKQVIAGAALKPASIRSIHSAKSLDANPSEASTSERSPAATLRLSPDDLFHPFSKSPVPEFRRRAAYMRQNAYCPHPDHKHARVPLDSSTVGEAAPVAEGDMAPAHVDFECPDCGIAVYCSKEHWMDDYENHLKICDTLRQINEDDHDLRSGRVFHEGNLPDLQMENAAVNMTNWDTFMYTREFEAVNSDRSMRQITRLLTYPITVGSVLHELSPYNIQKGGRLTVEGLKSFSALRYNLHIPKSGRGAGVNQLRPEPPPVRLFILGARAESSLPRPIWVQLAHLFPESRLHLIFIGPESMANRDDEFPLPERTPSNPFGTVVEDRVWYNMKISTIVDYYHTIHKTGHFAPYDPYFDCFVLFHPGLGHPASSHDWEETLPLLLETKVPIISTGYTQVDMERDVEWVNKKSGGEFDVLLEPGENTFRSLRWDLDDMDPQDITCGNWGVWAFRGKRYETTTRDLEPTSLYAPTAAISGAWPSCVCHCRSRLFPRNAPATTPDSPAMTAASSTASAPLAPARAPTTPRSKHVTSSPPPEAGAGAAVADRRSNRPGPVDPLSDRATLSLIRRTLCPQQLGDKGRDAQLPIEELLPPLTSRNDVDLQLYAFLAIIMREFVQSWYSKITTDETFVPEILHIIAHCTTALEQRVALLYTLDLPLTDVYHSISPLPFLSPVPRADDASSVKLQKENEATYRQLLVQAVLAILLPTEDLENPCLTALVEQILSELIIGNVIAGKASQPWLLFEAICIAARSLDEQKARAKTRIVSGKDEPSPSLSALGQDAEKSPKWTAQGVFVLVIHLSILLFNAVRFMVVTLADSISLPPRTAIHLDEEAADPTLDDKQPSPPTDTNVSQAKVPVLAYKLWTCFGNLIELEERKPWLGGFISLLQTAAVNGPWRIAGLDGPLDSSATGRPIEVQDSLSRLRLLEIVAPAWATANRPVHREAFITRRLQTGAISYERKRVATLAI
ncbi:protein MSS51, mitochondrial [Trichoderma asperellum]|uniref:Protein MSS51, mitochondrial n=1 Tax=Trichoderma asperellum TaxID=101201 RepID=A0A6V8QID5_TRIAP|nr:protein MSS51, mitochondrial [Trichoderma asperellum]